MLSRSVNHLTATFGGFTYRFGVGT